ncbi:D-alanyl-D-alanine carboxypeptidase [Shouchella lonarensis]|uniref:D-alanyl-D-alanine carboxypeptidase n=2 Tax=Shouchella lonarensis TaxID=1464122 RepID=A0A1G6LCU6_9BACI|nr:D-alanyl-D-alanine carboxypeptidase [Shouchella lonarensis]
MNKLSEGVSAIMGKKALQIWIVIVILMLPFSGKVKAKESPFELSGQAAILMEQSSGRVLYAENEHERLKIASITKIMTAILAIESGRLDEVVTISKRAEGTEGSSIYLVAGEKIPLRDLVYGLMLRSGNDAAMAIAEYVGGSVEGFVFMMNEKAEEIGMTNTRFYNPHGLDTHEDHLSSAYDMAKLTQYAMANETYRMIAGTKDYRAKGDHPRIFHNKNKLLTEKYRYSTGGKTGYTKLAKRTLVSTASKDGLDLIVVTLNDPNDWDDHMNLFNWGFKEYTLETLVSEGKLDVRTDDFYDGRLRASHTLVFPLTKEEKKIIQAKFTLLTPSHTEQWTDAQLQDPVGRMSFLLNNAAVASTALYFEKEEREPPPSFWKRIRQIFGHISGVTAND